MLPLLLACARPPVSTAPPTEAPHGPSMPTVPPATITAVTADVPLHPGSAAVGPADAKVVVVTYSDFQCPFCAHLFPDLVALSERRPDLRIVFESFPLDKDCNPLIESDMHRYACDAALAASCANAQGRYVALAEQLYQFPDQITPPTIPMFADQVGLDRAAFDACFADPATMETLKAHVASAVALGIDGTPTVLARGLSGDGWVQVSGQASAIVAALEAAPR